MPEKVITDAALLNQLNAAPTTSSLSGTETVVTDTDLLNLLNATAPPQEVVPLTNEQILALAPQDIATLITRGTNIDETTKAKIANADLNSIKGLSGMTPEIFTKLSQVQSEIKKTPLMAAPIRYAFEIQTKAEAQNDFATMHQLSTPQGTEEEKVTTDNTEKYDLAKMAYGLQAQGKQKEAENLAASIGEEYGDDPTIATWVSEFAGAMAKNTGDYKTAAKLYTEASKRNPTINNFYQAGVSKRLSSDYFGAKKDLEKVVGMDDNWDEGLINQKEKAIGNLVGMMKDAGMTEEDLEKRKDLSEAYLDVAMKKRQIGEERQLRNELRTIDTMVTKYGPMFMLGGVAGPLYAVGLEDKSKKFVESVEAIGNPLDTFEELYTESMKNGENPFLATNKAVAGTSVVLGSELISSAFAGADLLGFAAPMPFGVSGATSTLGKVGQGVMNMAKGYREFTTAAGATEVLIPNSKARDYFLQPISNVIKDLGYNMPTGKVEKSIVNLGDLVGSLVIMHGVKVAGQKGMNAIDAQQVKGIVDKMESGKDLSSGEMQFLYENMKGVSVGDLGEVLKTQGVLTADAIASKMSDSYKSGVTEIPTRITPKSELPTRASADSMLGETKVPTKLEATAEVLKEQATKTEEVKAQETSKVGEELIPKGESFKDIDTKDIAESENYFKKEVNKNNSFSEMTVSERRDFANKNVESIKEEKVSINDITPTQELLDKRLIEKSGDKTQPVLVKQNGEYQVLDGHHRIANDILNGKETIDAKVIDLDSKSQVKGTEYLTPEQITAEQVLAKAAQKVKVKSESEFKTSIKMAELEADSLKLDGLSRLEHIKKSFTREKEGEIFERVKQQYTQSDGGLDAAKLEQMRDGVINTEKGSIDDTAALFYDRAMLRDKINKNLDAIDQALKDGADTKGLYKDHSRLIDQLDRNTLASSISGYEASRMMTLRKAMINSEFGIENLEREYKASTRKSTLTPEEAAMLKEKAAKFDELSKNVEELESGNVSKNAVIKEYEKLVRELKRERKTKARVSVPKTVAEKYVKSEGWLKRIGENIDSEIVKNRGLIRQKSLGQFSFNPVVVPVLLGKQALLLATKGGIKLVEAATEVFKEFKDIAGVTVDSILKGAEDFAKQEYRTQIKDLYELNKDIFSNEKLRKEVRSIAKDKIRSGVKDVDSLVKDIHTEMKEAIPEITEREVRDLFSGDMAKTAKKTKGALELEVAEYKKQSKLLSEYEDVLSGKIRDKKLINKIEQSDVVKELKAKVAEAKSEAGITEKDWIEKRIQDLEKRTVETKEKIENEDYITSKEAVSAKYKETVELQNARIELNRARSKWKADMFREEAKHWDIYQKIADKYVKTVRGGVLGYGGTLLKIGGVMGHNLLLKPLELSVQKGWAETLKGLGKAGEKIGSERLASLKEIAKQASIYGDVPYSTLADYYKGFGKSLKPSEIKKLWKNDGFTDSELLLGEVRRDVPLDWYDKFMEWGGKTHGVMKGTIKTAEKAYASAILNKYFADKGLDISSKVTSRMIEALAINHGSYSILMNQNKAVQIVRQVIKTLDKNPFTKAILSTDLPIIRVPTNYVARAMVYEFGLLNALTGRGKWSSTTGEAMPSIIKVIKNSAEGLTDTQANFIMKNLTKGSIGMATLMTGIFMGMNGQVGLRKKTDKEKELQKITGEETPEQGEFEIGGESISKKLLHHPLLENIFIGASIGEALSSEDEAKSTITNLIGANFKIMGNVPFLKMPPTIKILTETMAAAENGKWGKTQSALVNKFTMGVPGYIKETAKAMDKEGVKYAPRTESAMGLVDYLKMTMPYLRQQVRTADEKLMETRAEATTQKEADIVSKKEVFTKPELKQSYIDILRTNSGINKSSVAKAISNNLANESSKNVALEESLKNSIKQLTVKQSVTSNPELLKKIKETVTEFKGYLDELKRSKDTKSYFPPADMLMLFDKKQRKVFASKAKKLKE